MINDIKSIHKTIQSTGEVVNGLMGSAVFENSNDAFVTLKACLTTLRDRLGPGEAIHLGGQLTALLRGFYYESWNYTQQSKIRTRQGFLDEVRQKLKGHEYIDLELAVPECMKMILDIIDQGEAVQILHAIPKEIRDLCP